MNITVNSPLNARCHLLSGVVLEQADSLSVMNLRGEKRRDISGKKILLTNGERLSISIWVVLFCLFLLCARFLACMFCEQNVCHVKILQGTVSFFNFYSHAFVRIIYERING